MILSELDFAKICLAAYLDPADLNDKLFDQLTYVTAIDSGVQCILVSVDDTLIVATRGTQSILHWLINVRGGSGFEDAANRVFSEVARQVQLLDPKFVWYVGHSLGGAVSNHLAWMHITQGLQGTANVFTMGAPRPGRKAWSRKVGATIEGCDGLNHRIVNPTDPIPFLPILNHGHTAKPDVLMLERILPKPNLFERISIASASLWQLPVSHWKGTYIQEVHKAVTRAKKNGYKCLISFNTQSS